MSPTLKRFLRDYLAWVEQGAPDDWAFSRRSGLCVQTKTWARERRFSEQVGVQLKRELLLSLKSIYPFNETMAEFLEESEQETAWLNERRRAWVRSQV